MKYFNYLSVIEFSLLVLQLCLSKILFPTARIIRFPFRIRRQGKITINPGFSAQSGLVMETFNENSEILIGSNVYVNHRLHIGCIDKVIIGNNVLIGSDCLIIDHNHGKYDNPQDLQIPPLERKLFGKQITIGNNVWIGDKVVILPGVSIGDNCVIGSLSVVTKSLPSNSIALGSPAIVHKTSTDCFTKWK